MTPTLLALGAHYDDCVFGIPGIMVKAARRGYRVAILTLIGDYTNFVPAIGRERALVEGSARICEAHGAELRFLGLKSQHYDVTEEAKVAVAQAVLDVRPDVAFVLWPHDRHADHGPAARLGETALRHAGTLLGAHDYRPPGRLYAYDNGPRHTVGFEPDVYVDVTAEWPEAMDWLGELMALARDRPYDRLAGPAGDPALSAKATLASYRGAASGVPYAEALRALGAYPQEILSLPQGPRGDPQPVGSPGSPGSPR
jgi:LmbE family N-acetylglucosaminyl deacetylase